MTTVYLSHKVVRRFQEMSKLYCPCCGLKGIWVELGDEGQPKTLWGCVICYKSWYMNTWVDDPLDMESIKEEILRRGSTLTKE